MEKLSGIYSIVHIESGRPYVGSALDIHKRWSEHKSELIYNYHDNPRLQNFWNKYGESAFEFRILEIVVDPSLLLIREQFWMDKLQSYGRDKGFNIRNKAESNFGLKHLLETIEKIRQSNIGKHSNYEGENNPFFGEKHTIETKQKMRKPKSEEGRLAIKVARVERAKLRYKETLCSICGTVFSQRLCENKKLCSKSCRGKFLRNKQLGK